MVKCNLLCPGILLFVLLPAPVWLSAGQVDEAIGERIGVQDEAQRSQRQVDQLADETLDMEQEYRETLRRIENTRSYNEQLKKQIQRQEEELASFERQLTTVEETQRNLVPLMSRMLEVLAELVELDTPFLPAERQARIAALQDMMYRPDVTLPDKFRRIMEAYQIEMDYGRNIETYEGELEHAGRTRTVAFLRLGRLGLYYQTLDGTESGYWNIQQNTWQTLATEFNTPIRHGLSIARKEAPPDFFIAPVGAPERQP
ncbi:MAG: DUF3450 domain-containing protein [Gammaproteobacteria bacterium]